MLKAQFSRKVFIVHGHDDGARETVARFLERIGLEAIILHEQANQGRTIIEKVVAHSDVGFAVVLLTPDDEGCVKEERLSPEPVRMCFWSWGTLLVAWQRQGMCSQTRGGGNSKRFRRCRLGDDG